MVYHPVLPTLFFTSLLIGGLHHITFCFLELRDFTPKLIVCSVLFSGMIFLCCVHLIQELHCRLELLS